jgi:hypothetical protein
MFIPLLTLAAAHADSTVKVNVGAGGGLPYGVGGAIIEIEGRDRIGPERSAHLGVGVAATVGGHLWSSGERVRVGLGASVSALWQDIGRGGSCGYVLTTDDETPPEPSWGITPSLYSADVTIDHDIGSPDGLSLRYGLGAGLVVAGCVGGVLPLPTLALSYRF